MRFVCFIYHDLQWFDRATPSQREMLHTEAMAYDAELARRGNLVVAQALRSPRDTKKVRVRRGKTVVIDGPYAETKEQLIGFILIEAKDMDEAVAIAADEPMARTGTVVVREAYFAAEEGSGA